LRLLDSALNVAPAILAPFRPFANSWSVWLENDFEADPLNQIGANFLDILASGFVRGELIAGVEPTATIKHYCWARGVGRFGGVHGVVWLVVVVALLASM
jgi:hypothetical protein